MYVVIEKKSRKVVHVNPAPLEQKLEGKDVYFEFDARSMEIVRSELRALPEHFEIKDGDLVEPVPPPPPPQLAPDEKIVRGKVVPKTLAEKVADKLVKLAPDEKVEGEEIVKKTVAEQLEEELITLAQVKKQRIAHFSALSLQLRAAILPDFKLHNAALGVYDARTVAQIKKTVVAFRDEFDRLEELVKKAKDLKALDAIKEKFPRELP